MLFSLIVKPLLTSFNSKNVTPAFMLIFLTFYLGMFILSSVLKEVMITKPLWIHRCETTTIHGFEAVKDTLAQQVIDETATGEGVADALDFGGV
jgi:hypothetical protein